MYKVIWRSIAEDALDKLPDKIADQIIKKVESYLVQNPRQLGAPLTGRFSGLYRYRIGDYRVIYEIRDDELYIYVVQVGHRKDVYE